jgi:tryptophan synthase alpha subunit
LTVAWRRNGDSSRKVAGRHAAGCVVGSALVEELEAGRDPVAFLRGLRASL